MAKVERSRCHPNWRLAESVLSQVIPGATGFDPDQIPGLSPEAWNEFDLEDREPAQVTRALLEYCQPVVAGVLIVVTFDSFRNNVGPFFVSVDHFPEFALSYPDVFDDVLVGGDVVIVSPSTGHVVVVHHNGLIATLSGVSDVSFLG